VNKKFKKKKKGGRERGVVVDEVCSYSSLHWASLFPSMGVVSMSMYDSSRSTSAWLWKITLTATHIHSVQNVNDICSRQEMD